MLNSFYPKIQTLFIKFEFKFEFVLLHTPLSLLITQNAGGGVWTHAGQHSKPTLEQALF